MTSAVWFVDPLDRLRRAGGESGHGIAAVDVDAIADPFRLVGIDGIGRSTFTSVASPTSNLPTVLASAISLVTR